MKSNFNIKIQLIIKKIIFFACTILSICVYSQSKQIKLLPPDEGVYHTAFSRIISSEHNISQEEVTNFIEMAKKKIVWMNVSNHWFEGIKFPKESAKNIWSQKVIPNVRMMPWSKYDKNDKTYSLSKILSGKFDKELKQYALDAKACSFPLLIEFAPEPNGDWFPWSGANNRNTTGTSDSELYIKAYKHVFSIFEDNGVNNVTWIFHVNSKSSSEDEWNKISNYYPGDEFTDWIGVSIYGPQRWGEKYVSFKILLDRCYNELCSLSPDKPLAVVEFGIADYLPDVSKPIWMQSALYTVTLKDYGRIKAIGWWNSTWWNADGTISALQIDSSPASLTTYRESIGLDFFKTEYKLSN